VAGAIVSTVTFDTLKFVKTLGASGIEQSHAKAIAPAYRDASTDQELVTKIDLQQELGSIKSDLHMMKWMMGLILGGARHWC